METVIHRSRGECRVVGETDSFLVLVDKVGNRFEAVKGELVLDNVVSIAPFKKEETLGPYPDSTQVWINLVKERELSKQIPGIGLLRARAIVTNRPDDGYKDWEQLKNLNPNIPYATWETLQNRHEVRFDRDSG